jgi:hypothetical protein
MMLWVKRDAVYKEDEMIITFDPPELEEENDWVMYTTRDHHYTDIAKELDKQAKVYEKANDHRASMVAKNLAAELRKQIHKNPMIN